LFAWYDRECPASRHLHMCVIVRRSPTVYRHTLLVQIQQQQQQQQAAVAAAVQQSNSAVPNKRAALDKSGIPMYQPVMSHHGLFNPYAAQLMPTAALQNYMPAITCKLTDN
jgi:hypothetical protein